VELAPAYGIVPTSLTSSPYRLALRCGTSGGVASLDNALSDVAPFGLSQAKAEQIVEEMLTTCREWPQHFADCGIQEQETEE